MVARGPEQRQEDNFTNNQTQVEKWKATKGTLLEQVGVSNPSNGANLNSITPQEAQTGAEESINDIESKNDIQMLNEIIKAFNEDKDWKLTNLRFEYNALTNKIMASYNAEIQKMLENSDNEDNKEDMGSKEDTESSAESEERPWDFSEIRSISENPELAQRLSDDAMKPQPKEVLEQISDINEVLEKWSEENKKILEDVISEVQWDISNLYHAAWLDKNKS